MRTHNNSHRGAVVLIVDDDQSIRDIARAVLEDEGLVVFDAASGEEALDIAHGVRPNLILMDVNMGGMDGFEATARFRSMPGFELVPIMFLTSNDDAPSIARAYEVGATDFAAKPINWTIISHRCRYMLRVVDMTDQQKRLLAEVHRAQKLEAIAALSGGIAHDFNNVLHAISGTAEMMQMDLEEDSQAYSDLSTILEAVESGSGLIRQLLSSGQANEGERKAVDLNDIIKSLQRLLDRAFPSNIHLESDLSAGGAWVEADRVQLERVLLNLAINARDAMPSGGKLVFRTSVDDRVRLTITDSGHGMDETTVSQVFEPFFSTKSRDKGTGLGLSMVHDIITANDGQIECSSNVGEGTTFEISLPKVSPDSATISSDEQGHIEVRA